MPQLAGVDLTLASGSTTTNSTFGRTVLPVTSLDVGKNVPDHLSDRNLVSWVYYTYPFNLTGQPAATVCAGVAPGGMPVGLQIVGRALGEADVVRAAAAYERSQPAGYNVRPFTPP